MTIPSPVDTGSLLQSAANAEFGIAVGVASERHARYLRRRLYSDRNRLRKTGATELDGLSIIIRPVDDSDKHEVWIVRRGAIAKPPLPPHQTRDLAQRE